MQVTRGDYLKDLITIYVENNLQTDITDLYSKFIFQCGDIQKELTPAQIIKISFNETESLKLKNSNTCYLAGITTDGHKETFNGSLTFNTRGEVVYYEPNVTPNVSASAGSNSCDCRGLNAIYSNCSQPAIKAYFSLNYAPSKLSELVNDTNFVDSVDVADAISEHNTSENAHPYIQELISTAELNINTTIGDLTELDTSVKTSIVNAINSEVADRESADTGLADDYNAKIGTLSDLESSVKTDVVSAINSVISDTDTTIGDLDELDTSVKTSVVNAINSEVSDRTNADNDLQGQIDALSAASDVTDIVGTYAELEAYDTQHLNNNDIIKVLTDETHDDAPSYYRFNKTTNTFSYIGSESASYTKAEADATFVPQTRTVNSKALSSDITLNASDVGALASTTTINDLTTTAQQNALNSGATTTNIGQIATNTSSISTINGKIPSDASSSNKLVTANALSNAVVNLANQDLSNLTQTGNDRLHALKSYSDNGELLTDAEGLQDVTTYAHSTFDSSKFTVVGSPVITSDGIASGFSNSNFVDITNLFDSSTTYTAFKFGFAFEYTKATPEWLGELRTSDNNNRVTLQANATYDKLTFSVNAQGTTYSLPQAQSTLTLTQNHKYSIYVLVNTTTATAYLHDITTNETKTQSISAGLPTLNANTVIHIGKVYASSNYYGGSIDLRYSIVEINGTLVFSGNKTGIDTIKSDDYTVVGSPTISDDGVASGFSASNYITATLTNNPTSSIDFECRFNIASGLDSTTLQDIIRGSGFVVLYTYLNSHRRIRVRWGSSTDNNLWDDLSYDSFAVNTWYVIKGHYDVATKASILTLYDDNGNILATETNTLTGSTFTTGSFTTYIGSNASITYFSGKVDLNTIKLFNDGSLIYQPCLKIPYTLSKTGSKVVNYIYRDRVNDMAEQFGNANYYTLSDTDFTLPQVELYGLLGDKRLVKSYYNGLTYWELYSNRRLEQGGTCESGVEYTFTKPFIDTNYVLTIPYSSKTATTFIPSATGDFIAKGTGTL